MGSFHQSNLVLQANRFIVVMFITITACSPGQMNSSSSGSAETLVVKASGSVPSNRNLLLADAGDVSAFASSRSSNGMPIRDTSLPTDAWARVVLQAVRGFYKGAAVFDIYSCMGQAVLNSGMDSLFDGNVHILSGVDASYKYRFTAARDAATGAVTAFEIKSCRNGSAELDVSYTKSGTTGTLVLKSSDVSFSLAGAVSGKSWAGAKTLSVDTANGVAMDVTQSYGVITAWGSVWSDDFYARFDVFGNDLIDAQMGQGSVKVSSGVESWADDGTDALTSTHYSHVNAASLSHHTPAVQLPTWNCASDPTATPEVSLGENSGLLLRIQSCRTSYQF